MRECLKSIADAYARHLGFAPWTVDWAVRWALFMYEAEKETRWA